jgi:sugar lactone lactonase YvrE
VKLFRVAGGAILTVVALAGLLLLRPAPIDPLPWTPLPKPLPQVGFEANTDLRAARRLAEGKVRGPEDVAFDDAGRLYTGTADGTIARVSLLNEAVDEFARTGGRPLGLMFDPQGRLVVCDAAKGLLAIDREGRVNTLAQDAEGVSFRFTNNLDIAADGTIYFSDSSDRFGPGQHLYDLLEARPHGRLLRFDPATGKAVVLLRDLYFANGVALAKDESYVLVAETYRYRVTRFWLRGPKAGQRDVFVDNLPGFPDNLARDPNGTYWVALFTVRNDSVDALHPHPFLKRLLSKLPPLLWPKAAPYGLVVNLNGSGRPLRSFHDPGGSLLTEVTTARPHQGVLYLGTLERPWLGRYTLPQPFVPVFEPARP